MVDSPTCAPCTIMTQGLVNESFIDGFTQLKNMRVKYAKCVIFGHLNINSLPGKFDFLHGLISESVDILVVTETKTDASFPSQQFLMQSFGKPYRADRNCFGGGIFIYIRENIPCRLLVNHSLPNNIEAIFVELNFKKRKWLVIGTYRPPSLSQTHYFSNMQKAIDLYRSSYENFVILGDLNMEVHESAMEEFCVANEFSSLVRVPTCFKSKNARCIDLVLTNRASCFQGSTAVDTTLSDFHKMIVTAMKEHHSKAQPIKICYRDYKSFSGESFRKDLEESLNSQPHVVTYGLFESIFLEVLKIHAPLKHKTIRGNHKPFMTKTLKKAIMTRSRFKNRYLKTRSIVDCSAYKRQRNYCSHLYRKTRQQYFKNLNIADAHDSKAFWRIANTFISDKGNTKSKISLIDNGDVVSD